MFAEIFEFLFSTYSSSQSAKYSNVATANESELSNDISDHAMNSSHGASGSDLNYRQGTQVETAGGINSTSEGQSNLADGILVEQLAGIQGAIDAMESTEINEEEDSLSLLMNVIENEDLGSILNDMPWNFM